MRGNNCSHEQSDILINVYLFTMLEINSYAVKVCSLQVNFNCNLDLDVNFGIRFLYKSNK